MLAKKPSLIFIMIIISLVTIVALNTITAFASTGENSKQPAIILAIDRVYPFSDFNNLMDMAEMLNDRGIDFIVTIMPVYDNYDLEAFDIYIKVLKYVKKMGGTLFIGYPVENEDGTYNLDPKVGFNKAVAEYRKRGLDIKGITLTQDKLLTKNNIFEGLNLPFILVTENRRIIDSNQNLQQIRKELNHYVIINGIKANDFDYFLYQEKKHPAGQQAIYVSSNDKEKLLYLLKIFSTEGIPITGFDVRDYYNIQQDTAVAVKMTERPKEKLQIESFMDEEMQKIKGENLEQEKNVKGYDISKISNTAIRVAIIILGILLLQVLISRYYNRKKFFKD